MRPFYAFLSVPILLVAQSAFADPIVDEPPVEPRETWSTRVTAVATGEIASYDRAITSPQSAGGGGLGGELRIHPDPMSGAFFAGQTGGAIFGPTLTTLDLGYSLNLFPTKRLKGVTGSFYLDVGPSLGFVWVTYNELHHDFGGRIGVAADIQIWNVVVGAQISYRGGLPIDGGGPTQWESAVMGGLRLGLVFDLGSSNWGN